MHEASIRMTTHLVFYHNSVIEKDDVGIWAKMMLLVEFQWGYPCRMGETRGHAEGVGQEKSHPFTFLSCLRSCMLSTWPGFGARLVVSLTVYMPNPEFLWEFCHWLR